MFFFKHQKNRQVNFINMPPIAWPEAKRLWNDDKGDGREKFLIATHK